MMKVLVTGGAGFIGWHVVRMLVRQNYEVVIIDDLSTGRKENIHPAARFFQFDVAATDLTGFFQAERFDYVIHLAAQTAVPKSILRPDYDCQVNVLGTINILEAARKTGVKRVVFSSSAAVYGDVAASPIGEDCPARPNSFYGLSKLTAERYLELYSQSFGSDYIVLRYANVYGERQGDAGEGGVVSIFTRCFRDGASISVYGDGGQTRDFIYAGDVALANYLALKAPQGNKLYNISTGTETSVNKLIDLLAIIAGKTVERHHLPPREGDIYRSSLANSLAVKELGWQPAVSLQDGLAATYRSLLG